MIIDITLVTVYDEGEVDKTGDKVIRSGATTIALIIF